MLGWQVLVATLGTEPQVVTLTLDLLQAKGYAIGKVIVVHTAGKVVRPALEALAQEFAGSGSFEYHPIVVKGDNGPVADIVTEADTAAFLRTLYRVVLAEKRAGRLVHLCIAGGRKPMAAYGMAVAQLLFDEDDRVWHLLSEGWRPGGERVMHVRPGDRVWLVSVPVLRWSSVSPVLTEIALREDPWEAIQLQPGRIAEGPLQERGPVKEVLCRLLRRDMGQPDRRQQRRQCRPGTGGHAFRRCRPTLLRSGRERGR